MATIVKCNCESEYQDKAYGPGNRVHNEAKDKNGITLHRLWDH